MSQARRTPLIAGNWKMNGSLSNSQALVEAIVAEIGGFEGMRILFCPPHVYLRSVADWIADTPVAKLGAQDLSEHHGNGAFTGEVSGTMLRDVGCTYAIVGHSERRALFGDTDRRIVTKFCAAQAAGLVPILCVGETLEQRERERTQEIVTGQIQAVLDAAGVTAFANAVIAYEPVWAIGTGRTATPEQAQEVHAAIRAMVGALDDTIAAQLTVLYGGSVKGRNAAALLAMDDIDGGLIGGASLSAEEFSAICRAAVLA